MKNNKQVNEISRREFLRNSVALTVTSFLPMGGNILLGSEVNPASQINKIPFLTLNNGIKMPYLGFGTLYLNGEQGIQCVNDAISVGYRLIDTATIYGNEESVGTGIKESGINRQELFITSKLWVDDSGYETTKKAFETSLSKLGTDYLDLYLIHRPRGDVKGTWKAMEELYKAGKIKAIGVSNFEPHQLEELKSHATIQPAVNQIETHAFFQENIQHDLLKKENIQMEAWSPLAQGRNGLFSNPALMAIGQKHGKTVAQVCLRWHFQRGVVAIPRTSQKTHMIENLQIFDFELDINDLEALAALDLNITQFPEWE